MKNVISNVTKKFSMGLILRIKHNLLNTIKVMSYIVIIQCYFRFASLTDDRAFVKCRDFNQLHISSHQYTSRGLLEFSWYDFY